MIKLKANNPHGHNGAVHGQHHVQPSQAPARREERSQSENRERERKGREADSRDGDSAGGGETDSCLGSVMNGVHQIAKTDHDKDSCEQTRGTRRNTLAMRDEAPALNSAE